MARCRRSLGGVRPRHTCRGPTRSTAAVRPSEVESPERARRNAVLEPCIFRGLVGPVGALQAVFGCVRPRHTCRGLARLTAAVRPFEVGLSGARKAERSFGAMYFSWPGGPRWRATSGLWVCAPQAHSPWAAPLDSRRQTVRCRPLRCANGGTQFWSHQLFVD